MHDTSSDRVRLALSKDRRLWFDGRKLAARLDISEAVVHIIAARWIALGMAESREPVEGKHARSYRWTA